jgi:conjugal transfer pilus assembly protein TraF
MAPKHCGVSFVAVLVMVASARADDGHPSGAPVSAPTSVSEAPVDSPAPRYFLRHAEGWFWYHDPLPDQAPTDSPPPTPSTAPLPAPDPETAIADERHTLEVALDRALLQPTPENVQAYLALNQKLMNQASAFADSWRGVIWSHPDLDHTVQSPVGPAAYLASNLSVDSDEDHLASDAKQWGLLFFFKGSCPYCHKFAPLLKQFAQRYGFQLVAITQDGGTLPEFPQPQADAGASGALGIDAVPAVFVVNPATRTVAPAAFGLVSWSDLTQRVRYAIDHASDNLHDAPSALAAAGHGFSQ